jgi:LysM repeat protein
MEGSRRYEVKAGDSLWKISKQHYGEGRFWTRLYVHNNRPDALRVTKKPILDPNVIHPGQLLLLPVIPADVRKLYPTEAKALELAKASDEAPKQSGSNAAELVRMRSFPYKYKLDNEFGPIPGPGYSWKLKVSGTIVIAGKNALPLIAITQKSAELADKKELDGALAKSIHESKLVVDFLKNQVKYENMLTIKAGKGAPASASLGAGMSPAGKPILKARIVHQGLAGTFDKYVYFTPEV